MLVIQVKVEEEVAREKQLLDEKLRGMEEMYSHENEELRRTLEDMTSPGAEEQERIDGLKQHREVIDVFRQRAAAHLQALIKCN